MTIHGLLDVYCTKDHVDEDAMCDFVEYNLLPHLLPFDGVNHNSVVVLDNASIHHTNRVMELIHSGGAIVHFLPPYSPHLNPIEEMFSKIKSCLKDNEEAILGTRDDGSLIDFVYAAFSLVSSDDCYGWYEHAGYV